MKIFRDDLSVQSNCYEGVIEERNLGGNSVQWKIICLISRKDIVKQSVVEAHSDYTVFRRTELKQFDGASNFN